MKFPLILLLLTTATANDNWHNVAMPNGCVKEMKYSTHFDAFMRTLSCQNCSLANFPQNSQIPTDVQVINLSENKIRRIVNAHLVLPELLYLDLSNNEINSIMFDSVFEGLFNLRVLNLSANRIGQLRNNLFQGLFNLNELHLSGNKISSISDDSFRGLQQLKTLNLASNKLSHLQAAWWLGVRNTLENLHLSDNEVSMITTDNFKPLHHLISLDLSNNRLFRMSDKGFFGLNKLEILNLDSNRFASVPSEALRRVKTLKSLKFGRNPLSKLLTEDFFNLPSLQDLSLTNLPQLRLTEFNSVSNLPRLKVVQLSDNPSLSYLDPQTFAKCPQLTALLLHNNNLSAVDHQVTVELSSLAELSFYGNPLSCDCNSHWIWQQIKSGKKPKFLDADRIVCDWPLERKFRLLTTLTHVSLTCAPRILPEISPKITVVKLGDPLRLECRAIGVPKPNVTWLNGNGDKVGVGGNLALSSVQLSTNGVYSCLAANSVGFDRLDSNVSVDHLDVNLYASRVGQTAATLIWNGTDRGKFAYQLVLRAPTVEDKFHFIATVIPSQKYYLLTQLIPNCPYQVCLELELNPSDNQFATVTRLTCARFSTKKMSPGGSGSIGFRGGTAIGAVVAIVAIMAAVICLSAVGLKRSGRHSRYDPIDSAPTGLFSPKSDLTNLYCPLVVAKGQHGYEAAYVAIGHQSSSRQSTRRSSETTMIVSE